MGDVYLGQRPVGPLSGDGKAAAFSVREDQGVDTRSLSPLEQRKTLPLERVKRMLNLDEIQKAVGEQCS